jgi:hypothetical protein
METDIKKQTGMSGLPFKKVKGGSLPQEIH